MKQPVNDLISGKKPNKGQFRKGKSGNPGGRPPQPKEVKEMLKAATIPAVELLINTMNSEDTKPELRVRCAELLLDRTLGKAVQPLEANVTTQTIDWGEITTDELRRLAVLDENQNDSTSGTE
ncbi:MAG: DUF5681 domain-containing protein [Oscillospiraceae bacterium]|nr:DUF5681 domain-containing protein [Oscillospiraceae bacterium]